jgi:hypothetical protein
MTSFSHRNRHDNSTPTMNDNSQQPPDDSQDLSKHSFSENLQQYRESHLKETRDQQRSMQSELAPQHQSAQSTQEQSQTQSSQTQNQSQHHQPNQEQDR